MFGAKQQVPHAGGSYKKRRSSAISEKGRTLEVVSDVSVDGGRHLCFSKI
jgi:hypothetical protein